MKKSFFKSNLFYLLLLLTLIAVACKKTSDSSTSNDPGYKAVAVHLTDDPSLYDNVMIDIRYVEVKIDTNLNHDGHFDDNDRDEDNDHKDHDNFGKWDTLNIRPGVYDVMKFRNGLDTVLGSANLKNSRIEKVRLTLGNNNSVTVNGVSHPLLLAPGANNYAYVKIEDNDVDEKENKKDLWLDFDLGRSVIEINGNYYLRPFLRPFGNDKFSNLTGKVLPLEAKPVVRAYSGADTLTAVPEHVNGEFKIRGIKDGVYSVWYKGINGYHDTTINNVTIKAGSDTHLPLVTLRK